MVGQAQDSNVGERCFGSMFDSNVGALRSSCVQDDTKKAGNED